MASSLRVPCGDAACRAMLALAAASLTLGCAPAAPPSQPPPPSVVVSTLPEEPDVPVAGTEPVSAPAATMAQCDRTALIDDGEDNNNQVIVTDARSGYWYTYVDEAGSTITPEAGARGGLFEMSPQPQNGSQLAARISGELVQGSIVYAGMGLNFTDPRDQYDASRYGGITFRARSGAGTIRVRLQVPDVNTAPEGGHCTECFNDFGSDFDLTAEWQRHTVRFEELRQQAGWGNPRPPSIESKQLYGLIWQLVTPGTAYDVWVDDIAFVDC